MKDNRNNTLLLTVIAIATLLVAVIGATFAYFSSSFDATDDSEVIVDSALLEIHFDGDDANSTVSATGIQPKGTDLSAGNAFVKKTFTLSQKTDTTKNSRNLKAPYKIYLIVDSTTFTDAGAYSLESAGTEAEKRSLIVKITGTGDTGVFAGTQKYVPSAKDMGTKTVKIYDNDGKETTPTGVELGSGYFQSNTAQTHTYTLELFFLNNPDKSQDDDKGKIFTGHIAISTQEATA